MKLRGLIVGTLTAAGVVALFLAMPLALGLSLLALWAGVRAAEAVQPWLVPAWRVLFPVAAVAVPVMAALTMQAFLDRQRR